MFLWLPLTNFHPALSGDHDDHTAPHSGEIIKIFCGFVSNTPNGTTPVSLPPVFGRLKSPTQSKVFDRFLLSQDEEGGRAGRGDLSPALPEQPTDSGGEEVWGQEGGW